MNLLETHGSQKHQVFGCILLFVYLNFQHDMIIVYIFVNLKP